MKPYYESGGITIYHGDARSFVYEAESDVLVTDPPYGISYKSGSRRNTLADSIEGDMDTSLRDWVCTIGLPTICFGTWKVPPPAGTRETLVWDKGPALGMGALDIPWKRSWEEIYILGRGFHGRRDGAVLRFSPVQSMACNGRMHPHQKPVELMAYLISRCPDGVILDPFMGSGSTLRAAKDLHRECIGIELDEAYCEIAAKRLGQEVLQFA